MRNSTWGQQLRTGEASLPGHTQALAQAPQSGMAALLVPSTLAREWHAGDDEGLLASHGMAREKMQVRRFGGCGVDHGLCERVRGDETRKVAKCVRDGVQQV